jgi:hypothetical protein
MNTVVFAHRKSELAPSSLLPGKMELFSKLEDRDIRPVISLNAESAFDENSIEAHELTGESATRSIGAIALEDVDVIVNRLDRSVKNSDLPVNWVNAAVPTINENKLRSLVFRKHEMQEKVFDPLNLGIPGVLVETPLDAALFTEQHPSNEYIVKPTSGTFSKGVMRLSADEAVSFFCDDKEKLGKTLIQPAYDFTHAFPSSFEAYDQEASQDFETWSSSRVTKELRMYGFYTPDKTDILPVARAMNGQDNWFFVNPESLPEKLFTDTRNVLSRAAELTASRAIYGALDIAYGTTSNKIDPDFHIVEFNGRMPYLIGYDKHASVADKLRDMKADQIQRVIQNKGVK